MHPQQVCDDTQLSGVIEMAGGREAIQGVPDRLEKWAHENLTRFNKAEGSVLHQVGAMPGIGTDWGKISWRAALRRRTWGSWWMRSWTRASSARSQPGRPTVFWAA